MITDDRFRYALITIKVLTDSVYASMVMEDIAWLDLDRIQSAGRPTEETEDATVKVGMKRKRHDGLHSANTGANDL